MRALIISDLHSNLEALESVFQAAMGEYDEVFCCGDVVGYGPNPNEVIERLIAARAHVIRGNHDRVAGGLENPDWFGESARLAALWTRAVLAPAHREFLRALPSGPAVFLEGAFQLVHGSLLDEDEYVYDEDGAADSLRMTQVPVTFFGHTHFPCVFSFDQIGETRLEAGGESEPQSSLWIHLESGIRYLVNPGSVGQPRDGDRRAAYGLFDSQAHFVKLRRVEYDIAAVQEKMRAVRLPELLIDRLMVGE